MQGILIQGDSLQLDSLKELILLFLFTAFRFRRDWNSAGLLHSVLGGCSVEEGLDGKNNT